jgi:hypothetical protein
MTNNKLDIVHGKHFNPAMYGKIAKKAVLLTKKDWDADEDAREEIYSFVRYDIPMAHIELMTLSKNLHALLDGFGDQEEQAEQLGLLKAIENTSTLLSSWEELATFIGTKIAKFEKGE